MSKERPLLKKLKELSGNELGFGLSATVNNQRLLNKDGTTNIRRIGLPFFRTTDTYNSLITMGWGKFSMIILASYLLINALFAGIYLWAGIDSLAGTQGHTPLEHFFDAFFFSAQTISTVGYGHISPKGILTSSIAALESMLGLLAFAVATGLLYGRFSRPTARILYSKNILVAPYGTGKGIMFRLANCRSSQLIEIEAQLLLSLNVVENGKTVRKFFPLKLERSKINILTLSWTIVHPIDEDSPLSGSTPESIRNDDAEFSVMLKAFDDTFSQTVHSRTSYTNEEVVWDAKFEMIFAPDENGISTIDLSRISDYRPVQPAT